MAEQRQGVSDDAYKYLQAADANGDGYVSGEEVAMYMEFKRKELEDQDAQRDAMRSMTWFALMGMLLYPVTIVAACLLHLDNAAKIIGDIAPTYFVAISALVAAFFGANAYSSVKKSDAAGTPPPMMPSRPSFTPSPAPAPAPSTPDPVVDTASAPPAFGEPPADTTAEVSTQDETVTVRVTPKRKIS